MPARIRQLLANLRRSPACPDPAGNGRRPAGRAAPLWRLGAGMAFTSAELGHVAVGRSPCQAAALSLRSDRAGRVWPWASWFPRAGPVAIGCFIFSFSLLFEKRNDLENVWILKFAPNLLK